MKQKLHLILEISAAILIIAACIPAAPQTQIPQSTIDVGPIRTSAAQTIAVETTRQAMLIPTATEMIPPTESPTQTSEPTISQPTADTSLLPAETPTLWIPVSGDTNPTITARLDTNCRQGPDTAFEIVSAFIAGTTSEVFGALRGGGWWYIKNPKNDDPKYCWVWSGSTDVTGDTSGVQTISAIPTPMKSLPKVTVTLVGSPETSVVCPQLFTFTGTITTDRAADFAYQIVNASGNVLKSGVLSFSDDGSQTITYTTNQKNDSDGWLQLKIKSPVSIHSTKATYKLDCP